MTKVSRPAKSLRLLFDVDVVVVGGGAAGVAAAVTAAREGANTLLIERQAFLGGVMTVATLGGICGLYSLVDGEPVQLVHGFAEEVRERLEKRGGARGPQPWLKTASMPYDLFCMKMVLDDLARQRGLQVLLQSQVTDVLKDGDRIDTLFVRARNSEFAVKGRVMIDASGDAEVCALAGAPHAYDAARLQFPSTSFRMGGVDTARAGKESRDDIRAGLERAVASGLNLPRTTGGVYNLRDGVVHVNITRVTASDGSSPDVLDPLALTEAEFSGRRQVLSYLEAFRNFVPGYEGAYVLDVGVELGLRETRRIVGDYIVTTEDVVAEKKFSDGIAKNCWPIEEHGADRATRWVWLSPGGYSHIPFRALLPRQLSNVLVAGRCLSADHEAQAALRVTANCLSMGQAAGIAGAQAASTAQPITRDVSVQAIQERLDAHGAGLGMAVAASAT